MAGKTWATARPVRLGRMLVGRSRLRRPSDRLEGLILVLLCAAFLATVVAAPYFGERLYQSQRVAAAQLHPATAVLTQSAPSDGYMSSEGEAAARWRAPDGQQQKGILTTLTAPGISGASAGARVQVWFTASGQPQAQPPSAAEVVLSAVTLTIGAVCGTATALLICYWLCRVVLDRRRMAAWASEWKLTGPKWSTRL